MAEHILKVTKGAKFHQQLEAEQSMYTIPFSSIDRNLCHGLHLTEQSMIIWLGTLLLQQQQQQQQKTDLLAGIDSSIDYIEECLNRQEPLEKVLRLLCLQSLTNNGLKAKEFEFFRNEILSVRYHV